MSSWPTFVAVVRNGGNQALMTAGHCGDLIAPEHEFGVISPQMGSIERRAKLCDHLGMGKNAIISLVELQYFLGSGKMAAELTVVEAASEESRVASAKVWVDWSKACDAFKKSCPISAASGFLRAFLAEKDVKTSRRRRKPWLGLGHCKKIAPAIGQFLRAIGYELTHAPEQRTLKEQATVSACGANIGRLYLKACPRDSNETRCAQKLHELFPEHVAKAVGASLEMRAILMPDFGQDLLELRFRKAKSGRQDPYSVVSAAFKQWADIQQESASRVKELVGGGLPIHDADWIRSGLIDVIEFVEEKQCLSLGLQAKLRGCSALLERGFDLWEKCSAPKALAHGDFHMVSMAQPNGPGANFVFFDWASAFIGYPFLDLVGSERGFNPLLEGKTSCFENWAHFADSETIITLITWSKPIELLRLAIVDARYSASRDVEELWSKKPDIISNVKDMLNCLHAMHS